MGRSFEQCCFIQLAVTIGNVDIIADYWCSYDSACGIYFWRWRMGKGF